MLLGSDGPGGIYFDDVELARLVGVAGLAAILFEGGLTTAWRGIRPVLVTASLLATVGIAVTACATGLAAYLLFDLTPATALLLGAVVASTDAAAVFATLRFTRLRRRLARLLEAESGLNDPTAVALTIGLVAWIDEPGYSVPDFALLLLRQLSIGLVLGLALGALASRAFLRLPAVLGPFAPVAAVGTAAISFGATDVLGGSGFLAVYVVGVMLGNTPGPYRRAVVGFHQGLAFLAQVVLFVVLGLLVFPSRLGDVVLPGLALALVLMLVSRPLAVWISTAFRGYGTTERVLLSWAGLRGAVPIVLATFALSADIADSDTIFDAVFFVVVVSTVLQEPTLEPLARRLGLATTAGPVYRPPIEIEAGRNLELVDFAVESSHAVAGRHVRELGLPRDALVAVIVRDGEPVPPRGSTLLAPGDRLYVLARPQSRDALEASFTEWRAAREE
jgi:cell volume regulation protein A